MVRQWLIDKRKALAYTQKAVAAQSGISQASLCDMEKGKIRPSVEVAKRIAAVLGFEWTKFFEEG